MTIIIINIPIQNTVYASIWDDFVNYITDPCNNNEGDEIEHWNGISNNCGPINRLCPPWGKKNGRYVPNTCLVRVLPGSNAGYTNGSVTPYPDGQCSYPQNFIAYYMNYCVEELEDTSITQALIKVRSQTCNAFACWDVSKDLDALRGQCVNLAGPSGLPLTRICARIAYPGNGTIPASMGYMVGYHMDKYGAIVRDLDGEGNPSQYDVPKICAYNDPSFLDLSTGDADFFDVEPNKQPFHKTSQQSPIIKAIVFLIRTLNSGPTQIAEKLGDLVSEKVGGENGKIISEAIEFLADVFKALPANMLLSDLINKLESLGLNSAVSSTLGCVPIKLGPYPPPYCDTLPDTPPELVVYPICQTNNAGSVVNSTTNNLCVFSPLVNNFIANSVRIAFNKYVRLCTGNENPSQTSDCIGFNNVPNVNGVISASLLHSVSGNLDILPLCQDASGNSACINSQTSYPCSISTNGCNNGFRVLYAKQLGTSYKISEYYDTSLPDCDGSSNINCQIVWGANFGEFKDIPLVFPTIQSPTTLSPLTNTATLTGYGSNNNQYTETFTASIVRQSTNNNGIKQTPSQICIYHSNGELINCVDRQAATKPVIYDCSTQFAGITCNNNYFTPKFIASLAIGSYSTNSIVAPLSTTANDNTYSSINLAGYNFDSFVTDNTFIQQPFSGTNSISPSSIYGNYKDNVAPYTINNNQLTVNSNALYLSGLEYSNGSYFRGGRYACLFPIDITKCPNDTTICVLSYLQNANIVNCSSFKTLLSQYAGLRLCNSSYSGCSTIQTLPASSGGGTGVSVKECTTYPTFLSKYCYTSSNNSEVCNTSFLPASRYIPSASYGNIIPDSQYYNANPSLNSSPWNNQGTNYSTSTYVLRDKTAIELNLCNSMPQLSCSAVTTASSSTGYATWTAANLGSQSTGTCATGYAPIDNNVPLQRYCVIASEAGAASLEPLTNNVGCKNYQIILTGTTTNVPNIANQPSFSATSNATNSSGSVTFGQNNSSTLMFPSTGGGKYYSQLTFNIGDVTSNINYFRITNLAVDDFVLVTVNNNVIYSAPSVNQNISCAGGTSTIGSFNAMSYNSNSTATLTKTTGGTTTQNDTCTWNIATGTPINLIPYLQQGTNTIRFDFIVLGGGNLFYKIDYSMK